MTEPAGFSADERVRRANHLYEAKLKMDLESRHPGQIVAIDVQTGDHYVGDDPLEACGKGRIKHPDAIFVCRRIGDGPLYRVGAF